MKKRRTKKAKRVPLISPGIRKKFNNLMYSQKGKYINYTFICDLCKTKHTGGYLYVDGLNNEYELCKYCCKKNHPYVHILYTPTGNKR